MLHIVYTLPFRITLNIIPQEHKFFCYTVCIVYFAIFKLKLFKIEIILKIKFKLF